MNACLFHDYQLIQSLEFVDSRLNDLLLLQELDLLKSLLNICKYASIDLLCFADFLQVIELDLQ